MLHKCQMEWSCYSVDFLADMLGAERTQFPHTVWVAAGTQVEPAADLKQQRRGARSSEERNRLYVARWSQLSKMQRSEDDEDEEDAAVCGGAVLEDEETAALPPQMDVIPIIHSGCVNQVRSHPLAARLVATWSSAGHVNIWDVHGVIAELEQTGETAVRGVQKERRLEPALRSGAKHHKEEGYALDWHSSEVGLLASGDCAGVVCVWRPAPGGSWTAEQPLAASKAAASDCSVESLKWRNGGTQQLATAGGDGRVRVWDLRLGRTAAEFEAHRGHDVNCIAWNPHSEHVLLSGGDEGALKAWDLRMAGVPVAHLSYHKQPITAVDWNPQDAAVFAASSEDDSLTIWDMSVEAEDPTLAAPDDPPAQMLFQHMGQRHISDVRWHRQIPGVLVSTAESDVDIFKTIVA